MTTDATREHCVDAETLAAWADRGLPATEAAAVELHLSNCERCQEVLATFVRSLPHAAVVLPFWSRPAVRLGAAGLAVAASVTLIVWTNRPPTLPTPAATVASSDLAPAAPDRARQAEPLKQVDARRSAPASRPTPLPPAVTVSPAAGAAQAAPVLTAPPPPPPAAQAPPPPPVTVTAAAPTVGGIAQQTSAPTRPTSIAIPAMAERVSLDSVTIEIVAPDPLASASRMATSGVAGGVAGGRGGGVLQPARWRILGGVRVQRSVDGGTTWTVADLSSAQPFVLTAGSAASQNVCWLVGRDGAVLLSRNGLTFERIAFPQPVHLRSVQAIDALRAVVTAEDGRTFSTSDAGLTWVAGKFDRPLQGF